MDSLYKYIVENTANGMINKEAAIKIVTMLKQQEKHTDDDIAIIGIAGRFPLAENINEYWSNIEKGYDLIRKVPAKREEDLNRYLDFMETEVLKKYNENAFLESIDNFDYKFFKLSPKEASLMDPNQRLFLEVAWQAIEDSGYGGYKLKNTDTGVYLGYSPSSKDLYGKIIYDIDPSLMPIAAAGNMNAITSSRISYLLNLRGPSMIIDTACSSSLISLEIACQSIKNGYCSMAIVGGSKLNILPVDSEYLRIGIESSDGRTRTFDDSSDGSGLGEGVAALVLKPVKRAQKDGDNIYAVIKGSFSNQDGTSAGITAPNPAAQTEVIIKAWENAKVKPESISYIETHGTGTKLGDPIEIKGISDAFIRFTDKKQFCAVSSIKSNLGHLCEAAGMASLIKVAMAFKTKKIPPIVNFNRPNKGISFENSPVYVNTRLRDWEKDKNPRRCGISGFGISGTNCHVVLEEAPEIAKRYESGKNHFGLFLSANSKESLKNMIFDYEKLLKDSNFDDRDLNNICFTAATGRGHYLYRVAIIVANIDELTKRISFLNGLDDLENYKADWYKYGCHRVIGNNKTIKNVYDITEKEKVKLGNEANLLIDGYLKAKKSDKKSFELICSIYVKGADTNWDKIYKGEKTSKISLPVYSFDRVRCWVDVPEVDNKHETSKNDEVLFKMKWVLDELKTDNTNRKMDGIKKVIFISDHNIKCHKKTDLLDRLKEDGKEVIEIIKGHDYENLFNGDELGQLADTIIINWVDKIETDRLKSIDDLEKSQQNSVIDLFKFIKALSKKDIKEKLNLFVITDRVNNVTGKESILYPENATIIGFCKVLNKESLVLNAKCIDIDEYISKDTIIKEILHINNETTVAYRDNERYVEEFGPVISKSSEEEKENKKIKIIKGGNYLVTGGCGGIGIEISRYLSSCENISLFLLNRTKLPERDLWDRIISNGQDKTLCNTLSSIVDIEKSGSKVVLLQGDVTKLDEMDSIINRINAEHGTINGIVHGAGIAIDEMIINKTSETFQKVLDVKVKGAWILDYVTREQNLDFFIMFSSVATIFSAVTQSDYVAGNSFLDAFADFRMKKGQKTLTINWTTWKDTGMAARGGATVDTIFKTISNSEGIDGFSAALEFSTNRVLVGKINYEGIGIPLLERSNIKISRELGKSINLYKKEKGMKVKSTKNKTGIKSGNVLLTGRDSGDYSDIEKNIAKACKEILGFDEIDIYENFFELGADSILLMKIFEYVDKIYPDKIAVVDLFEHSSISKLAKHIGDDVIEKNHSIAEAVANGSNDKIDDIAIIGMSMMFPKADDGSFI